MCVGFVTVVAVKNETFATALPAFGTRVDDFCNPCKLIKEWRDRIGQVNQQITAGHNVAVVADGNRRIWFRCLAVHFVRDETARAERP